MVPKPRKINIYSKSDEDYPISIKLKIVFQTGCHFKFALKYQGKPQNMIHRACFFKSISTVLCCPRSWEEPSDPREGKMGITCYQMLLLSMHVQWRLFLPKSPELTSKQTMWFSRDIFIVVPNNDTAYSTYARYLIILFMTQCNTLELCWYICIQI